MITNVTLQKLAFEHKEYDTLLNGTYYNFTHPSKGKFIAMMPDKGTKIQLDSLDLSINLVFYTLEELIDWITEK